MTDIEGKSIEAQADDYAKCIDVSLDIARNRRTERFKQAQSEGYSWLLECRDMYDAYEEDAGVYFSTCNTQLEVDEKVKKSKGDQKVMGVYDLNKPLKGQGAGIAPENWVCSL